MSNGTNENKQSHVLYLRVSGTLLPDNRLMLRPSYLTENPRGSRDIKDSPLQIELYSKDHLILRWGATLGTVMSSPRMVPPASLESRGDYSRAGEPLVVFAKVPFPRQTDRIVFRYDDIKLLEIQVPARGPTFKDEARVVAKDDDTYRIYWKASHPDNLQVYYHVRTSADQGKTWKRLASRLNRTEIIVPRDALAGGNDCVIEVVAYDGVNTVASRTAVPDAPPVRLDVSIVSPTPRDTPLMPPISLRALGRIHGKRGFIDKETKYIWKANGKKIAEGPRVFWYDAKAGKYKITVNARSGKMTAQDSVRIQVGEIDSETLGVKV